MRMCKKVLCALIAVVLLSANALPAFAASTARLPVGLNGASGTWSEFDQSVYDLVTDYDQIMADGFVWPSTGNILVLEAASNTVYLIHRYEGLTIPAGLVVDFYKYSPVYDVYSMQAHFDTTDGSPYTISNFTTNIGAPATHDRNRGTALRTFTPNTPAETYSHSYSDVDPSAWYYDAVMTLTEGGLLKGYDNGKFGPNDPLTRAQIQIIVSRLHNSDYFDFTDSNTASRGFAAVLLSEAVNYGAFVIPTMYEDTLLLRETDYVPGLLFSLHTFDPVQKNYVSGLVPGYDIKLAMTRMNRGIYDNWLASADKNISYRYTIEDFPDGDAIHQWSQASVPLMRETVHRGSTIRNEEIPGYSELMILRAWNLGMFTGVDTEGSFAPDASMTRAQLCQVLYNMGWTYTGCLDYNSITLSGWPTKK
jgi:hypothetical protein